MVSFDTAFDLPLQCSEAVAADAWPELMRSYLKKVVPVFDESTLTEDEQDYCVDWWKNVIHEKQCANPEWMTQWLSSYGTKIFKVMTYSQLAALFDMDYDPERVDDWLRHPDPLLATKLRPGRIFWSWNYPAVHDKSPAKAARERLRRNLAHTRKLDRARTWEDYRPENKSPLREAWAAEDLNDDARDSAASPQPSDSSTESDACLGLVSEESMAFLNWQRMLLKRCWRTKQVRKPRRAQRCLQFLTVMVRELHTVTVLSTAAQTAAALVPTRRKTAKLSRAIRKPCLASTVLQ